MIQSLESRIACYVHGGKFKSMQGMCTDLGVTRDVAKTAINHLIEIGSIQKQRSYSGGAGPRIELVPVAILGNIDSRTNASLVKEIVDRLDAVNRDMATARRTLRELERRVAG